MVLIIIILLILWVVASILLVSSVIHIKKIQKNLTDIDREQHTQNMDIVNLIKSKIQHDEMLLQHIEVLKYLVEQDPKLGKKVIYTGPVGVA